MEIKSTHIEIDTVDDGDLDSVFFTYPDGYITMCRGIEEVTDEGDIYEEEIYMEKDGQEHGANALPKDVTYTLSRNELLLILTDEMATNLKTEKELKISFSADDEEFELMTEILSHIFS